MSAIDKLREKIKEIKKEHEDKTIPETDRIIGQFQYLARTSRGLQNLVARLAESHAEERKTRISEDIAIAEVLLNIITEQVKEIDKLKRLVVASASHEEMVEEIKKDLKEDLKEEFGEAFEFLENLKERIKKQEKEAQKKLSKYQV